MENKRHKSVRATRPAWHCGCQSSENPSHDCQEVWMRRLCNYGSSLSFALSVEVYSLVLNINTSHNPLTLLQVMRFRPVLWMEGHMRTLLSILAGFTGFFLVGCGQNTLPNKPTTPSTKVEFLYAASVVTNFGAGGIETYQIDSATHDISALTGPSFDFDFAVNFFPIGLVSDSSHQFLLSAFVTGPFSAEVQSYQRDSDGGLTLVTDMPVPGAIPVAIAMDPQNRFFYFVGIQFLIWCAYPHF
jgi:hypothetical protein